MKVNGECPDLRYDAHIQPGHPHPKDEVFSDDVLFQSHFPPSLNTAVSATFASFLEKPWNGSS